MATYGRGQMLGSGINPESFKQDYSGFANAAAIEAQGIANLGSEVGNYFKQQGEKKKTVKQASTQIDAAIKLFPDLAPMLSVVRDTLRDDDIPLSQRAADAETIAGLISMGVTQLRDKSNIDLEREKMEAELNYREAQLQASKDAEANKPGSIETIAVPGGTRQMVRNPRTGVFEPIKVAGLTDTNTSALGNLPDALKPFAKDFEEAGAKYGVAPNILAAISMHETGNGTSSAFRNKNNAMGISDASGPVKVGSVAESIDKMARLLGKGINEGTGPYANVKSIADIANIYAPPGAGNDPRNLNQFWTQGVTSNIQKLSENQAKQAQPTPQNQGEIGFTPSKNEKTGEVMTQEQVSKLIAQGFKVSGSPSEGGNIFVTDIQSLAPQTGGRITKFNPETGQFEIIEGSAAGVKEEKQKMAKENATDKAISLISDLNYLSDKAKSMAPGTVGALGRIVAEKIPATDQAENKQVIDRVRASLTLENLQAMRNNNPTGASLGTVSDKDTKLVEDSATALSNAQSPEAFQKEIIRLKNLQHDIIYGSERVLKNKLEKGEIKQADFDNAMAKAPAEYIDENGLIKSRKIQPIIPSSNSESVYEKHGVK